MDLGAPETPPEKPAQVKRMTLEQLKKHFYDTIEEGSRKKREFLKTIPPHITVPGCGFKKMALIGPWKFKTKNIDVGLKKVPQSLWKMYSLDDSRATVTICMSDSQDCPAFEELTKKSGPIDLTDTRLREFTSASTIEKAESRKLKYANKNLLTVQVLDSQGDRKLLVFIDKWLNQITFRAPPEQFDKYLPSFLQSLETIEWGEIGRSYDAVPAILEE